ncbi:MAG: hypothetical protein EA377_09765 [Phycisphaerales bacterium]|nr:MAG: hypothetical protein EA377_09765 [Phycisphaerales bacterium]
MAEPAADPVHERRRQGCRPWRIVFVLYAIALTIGTHWPRLDLSIGDVRAPDKIIHQFAFAGLAFLLWRTRWLRRLDLWFAVTLIWIMLDEFTQAIPIFGRTFSWFDILAGWCGAMAVAAWLWAYRSTGGPQARRHFNQTIFVYESVFMRFGNWIRIALYSAGMLLLVGAACAVFMWQVHPDGLVPAVMVGAAAGGVGGFYVGMDTCFRRDRPRLLKDQPCFACGRSCAEASIDENGQGTCPTCGQSIHLGQWLETPDLSRRAILGLATSGLGIFFLLSVLAVAVYLAFLLFFFSNPDRFFFIGRMARTAVDMRIVIDLTLLGVFTALAVRFARRTRARQIDEQDQCCLVCRHDVHMTRTERGIGRCPECGTPFVRIGASAGAGSGGSSEPGSEPRAADRQRR